MLTLWIVEFTENDHFTQLDGLKISPSRYPRFRRPYCKHWPCLEHIESEWVWNPKISPPQKDLTIAIDKPKAPPRSPSLPQPPFSINARASKYVKRTSRP